MSRRIDDNFFINRWQRNDLPQFNRIAPRPPAPTHTDDAARRAALNQYGDARRSQLDAVFAGLSAGSVAAQSPFVADARAQQAYQKAYGESLERFTSFFDDHIEPLARTLASAPGESGQVERYYAKAVEQLRADPAFAETPKSMLDVVGDAGQAYRTELGRTGFSPLDIARPNPHRAADFLSQYATDPNTPMTRLDPAQLQQRIETNAAPGDHFVRITAEPYMHAPTAVLSRSPRAWVTPMDEAAGFRLNAAELFAANGLSSDTPVDSQRMIVMNTADSPSVPATWDAMISTAQSRTTDAKSRFHEFDGRSAQFWADVQNFDLSAAETTMNANNILPRQYANNLQAVDSYQRDVFVARQTMNRELGVNSNFRGDGLVTYPKPDATPSAREFGAGERPMVLAERNASGNFPELATLGLDSNGAGTPITSPRATPVETTPHIPSGLNTLRTETRYGAMAGGATSFGISSFQAFDDVRDGRLSLGDAALQVGSQTALGTGVGAGSAVLENYATRGVSSLMGTTARTATAQMGRQALGSGVAGALINTGFAIHDNHAAYQRGEISGADYTGRITAEAAVGAAAGVGGAMAGAYIGGVIGTAIPIPVVGTLAGAAVGAAVGMGIDYAIRQTGVDRMIASGVTSAIEVGGQAIDSVSATVQDAGAAIGDAASGAGDALSDLAGGAASSLKSVFGW